MNGVKKEPLVLPEPDGAPVTITEKVFVPVKDHPEVRTVNETFNLIQLYTYVYDYYYYIVSKETDDITRYVKNRDEKRV